jgi:cytochrome c biogenesis protein CcmG/thiol:disulfide interchange protein DsbE
VLGAAVLLTALWIVLAGDLGAPPVVRGASAPAFSLPTLGADGEATAPLSLDSLRGRVVLVNFWATWCEPCESEMPAMERLYAALPRDEFELVAISIDEAGDSVRAFQDEYRLSFPILLDPQSAVYDAYQTMGVPESLLVDRDGRIVERYVGPREWDAAEYQARIREVMKAGGIAGP